METQTRFVQEEAKNAFDVHCSNNDTRYERVVRKNRTDTTVVGMPLDFPAIAALITSPLERFLCSHYQRLKGHRYDDERERRIKAKAYGLVLQFGLPSNVDWEFMYTTCGPSRPPDVIDKWKEWVERRDEKDEEFNMYTLMNTMKDDLTRWFAGLSYEIDKEV